MPDQPDPETAQRVFATAADVLRGHGVIPDHPSNEATRPAPPAEPETASERPDAGRETGGYTDEEYWAVVAERNKHAGRADAAESTLRTATEELEIARHNHSVVLGLIRSNLGTSEGHYTVPHAKEVRAERDEANRRASDPWHGLVEAAANVRAERDEARAKLDEIRDRAVGFHAFLLGPGSRNPDQVRIRAVAALDGIRDVFESETANGYTGQCQDPGEDPALSLADERGRQLDEIRGVLDGCADGDGCRCPTRIRAIVERTTTEREESAGDPGPVPSDGFTANLVAPGTPFPAEICSMCREELAVAADLCGYCHSEVAQSSRQAADVREGSPDA
jgi:hypothetical protein